MQKPVLESSWPSAAPQWTAKCSGTPREAPPRVPLLSAVPSRPPSRQLWAIYETVTALGRCPSLDYSFSLQPGPRLRGAKPAHAVPSTWSPTLGFAGSCLLSAPSATVRAPDSVPLCAECYPLSQESWAGSDGWKA